jgi:hypothetical protein
MSRVEFEVIFFSLLTLADAFVAGCMFKDGENIHAVVLLGASIITMLTALSEARKL